MAPSNQPPPEPDPWKLRNLQPSDEQIKRAAEAMNMSPGAMALAMKKLGYTVELFEVERWTPEKRADANIAYATGGSAVAAWLTTLFVGPGKVPGAELSRGEADMARQTLASGAALAQPPGSTTTVAMTQPKADVPQGPFNNPKELEQAFGKPRDKVGNEEPFAVIAKNVAYVFGIDVSLQEIASWEPVQRAAVTTAMDLLVAHRAATRAPVAPAEKAPEKVMVAWGAEKFTPVKGTFSTVEIGPFTATVAPEKAEETYRHLVVIAEAERERKIDSFIRKMADVAAKMERIANGADV